MLDAVRWLSIILLGWDLLRLTVIFTYLLAEIWWQIYFQLVVSPSGTMPVPKRLMVAANAAF